jgi:hypothetical protein
MTPDAEWVTLAHDGLHAQWVICTHLYPNTLWVKSLRNAPNAR